MKKSVLFLFLCFVTVSYAQNLPYDVNWYLFQLDYNGIAYYPPVNNEVPNVSANFYFDIFDTFETKVCDVCLDEALTIDLVNQTFNLSDFNCGQVNCANQDNQDFQDIYQSFFKDPVTGLNNPFTYETAIVDGDGTYPDQYLLFITNSNGDIAYYSDTEVLSTPDFDLSSIFVYPNPVGDSFRISGTDSTILSITVYDFLGRELFVIKNYQSNSPVKMDDLNSGVYFVKISSGTGQSVIRKISKQ